MYAVAVNQQGATSMSFVDTGQLEIRERLPGWRGRHFDSASMTFGYWSFEAGSSVHEHHHPQEEVWHIVEGELEVTVGGETRRIGPGMAAIVPANTPHSVRALKSGRAIVVDHPVREDF